MSVSEQNNESRQKYYTWKKLNSDNPNVVDSNKQTMSQLKSAAIMKVPQLPVDLLRGSSENELNNSQRFSIKTLSNPFVPVGVLLTTFCLSGMIYTHYKRDTRRFQHFMRGRIAAQGFTFLAAVCGTIFFISRQPSEN